MISYTCWMHLLSVQKLLIRKHLKQPRGENAWKWSRSASESSSGAGLDWNGVGSQGAGELWWGSGLPRTPAGPWHMLSCSHRGAEGYLPQNVHRLARIHGALNWHTNGMYHNIVLHCVWSTSWSKLAPDLWLAPSLSGCHPTAINPVPVAGSRERDHLFLPHPHRALVPPPLHTHNHSLTQVSPHAPS